MRLRGAYIGVLFVLLATFVSADPPGWSNDTRLTFNGARSMDPRITTDYNGDVQAVWSDFRGGFSQIYYTKIDGFSGNIVVGERRIVDAESTDASLATDSMGDVHVVYRLQVGNWQIFHTRLDNNGTVGQTRQLTSLGVYQSIIPVIAPDLRNTFHVAFQSGPDGTTRAVHYLGLNNDGTVRVEPVRVSPFLNVPEHISIGTDTLNEIHLAWHDPRAGDSEVYYSKISYNGVVIVNDLRVSALGGASQNPSLVVDRNNRVHIVWEDYRDGDFEIYYTQLSNNGTTLVDDLRLTQSIGGSRRPSLAVDLDGNIHVVWSDSRDGNAEIYYTQLSNNGTTLVDDLRLTTSTFDSHSPTLAFNSNDRGSIHVVWVDERDGNLELYYKYKYRLINLPPELQPIGTRQTNENLTLTVQLNASDPENDNLTFSTNAASVLPSPFFFNETSGFFAWRPTYRDAGNYSVTFGVSDGVALINETITITVHDVPLVLQHIGNREINENQTLAIQLEALQPGNAGFIYGTDAAFILPSLFSFNETTGLFAWMPTFRDSGDYAVTFNVTNGYDVANETINITVNHVNLAPEIQPILDINIVEGNTLNLRVNASDFDGDRLTYRTNAASILPSQFNFNDSNGEFTWNTGYTDYGNYTVTFTVSDGQLTSTRDASMFVRDAQISNLVMVGAPRIGNTVQLLLADRTAISQPYILLMSSSTDSPLALGDGRFVGLTPNTVFLVSLYLPTLIGLIDSVGIFNEAGNAIARWIVPNVPELANTTVHFAFVSLDTVQPGARTIISISPTINATVIS